MGLLLTMAATAAVVSIIPCATLLSYTFFRHPTRLILQFFVLLPVATVTSIVITAIGAVIKYLPRSLISEAFRIFISMKLYKLFCRVVWFIMEFWANIRYTVSSDETFTDDVSKMNAILMANHSATFFDAVPMGTIADHLNRGDRNFFTMKKAIMFYPILGWVESVLPHAVPLSRSWETDKVTIASLCARFKAKVDYEMVTPWMWFIFPEGTRFSQKRLRDAQEFAQQRGFPVLSNLLQPRVKGFSYLTHHLYESLGAVVDATILYKDMGSGFFWGTRICKSIHVHFRAFRREEIPKEINELDQWLRDRWTEKDEILKNMKEGNIPMQEMERMTCCLEGGALYALFAILSALLAVKFLCGAPLWSYSSLIAISCSLLPIGIVAIERTQEFYAGNVHFKGL